MKKVSILILALTVLLNVMHATVRTVSNNSTSPAQYSSIQLAITNSAVGDTIYVHGSETSYGNITINKRLTLIGAGYDVQNTDFNLNCSLGTLTFDSITSIPISGCNIAGFYFSGSVTYASGDRGVINNVNIERCFFDNYATIYASGNNWTIKNCIVLSYFELGYYKNIFIINNFLQNCQIDNSNDGSVYCMNNIIFNETYYAAFSTVTNMNVRNNIYWNNNVSGCTNCNFLNNITNDDASQVLPGSGNSGSGNFLNTDPKFVSTLPALTVTIASSTLKTYDWHLQPTSPGYNGGTDGTDIGIYGGSSPWPNFSGQSKLPVVQNFYIKNPVVQKDGSINIKVKAHKQQ